MLMVQSNAQVPMKNGKLKGPPPVPPRPNQSVVAEALAKTRKAVAESRVNLSKSRSTPKQESINHTAKAKTLERTNSSGQSLNVSPKTNGLARVKSFIKDVISDRSSSSDGKRSSGSNSRRSSNDSTSIPVPIVKKSYDSPGSKTIKTCKQILIRSLSTTNKSEQDKYKVSKSSSFAEKTFPLRKAPPPPLSPKPKLKPMKPLPLKRHSVENINRLPKSVSMDISPYSSPIDLKKPPQQTEAEAPYATVDEVQEFDDRLRNSPSRQPVNNNKCNEKQDTNSENNEPSPKTYSSLERKTSCVTEMLISEILASQNKNDSNVVIDKGKEEANSNSSVMSLEGETILKNMNNHEMLIYELQTMRSQSNGTGSTENLILNTDINGNTSPVCSSNGSDCSENVDLYAYVIDDDLKSRLRKQFRAISSMSLQGLPPLPKSLSGFADAPETEPQLTNSATTVPNDTKSPTDLDSQLNYLKKEMASLRQLDLSLLSELWSLSEAMASWRRQLERGPRFRPAPPPPPPPHYLRT